MVITLPATFGPGIRTARQPADPPEAQARRRARRRHVRQGLGAGHAAVRAGRRWGRSSSRSTSRRSAWSSNAIPITGARTSAASSCPISDQLTHRARARPGRGTACACSPATVDFMQQALRATDVETLRPLEAQGKVQMRGAGRQPGRRLVRVQPAAGTLGQRPARRVAAAQGVSAGAFARGRSRGVREHRVPRRGGADPRTGHARQSALVLAEHPALPVSRARRRTALLDGHRAEQPRCRRMARRRERAPRRDFTLLTFRGNRVLERERDRRPRRPAAGRHRRGRRRPRAECRAPGVVKGDFEAAFISFTTTDPDPAMSKDFWLSSGGAHFWNLGQTDAGHRVGAADRRADGEAGGDDRRRPNASGCSTKCSAFSPRTSRFFISRRHAFTLAPARAWSICTPALTRPQPAVERRHVGDCRQPTAVMA